SILHQALGFVAALRFQQQRSEIMNRVSQVVNNFLLHRCDCGVLLPSPAARSTCSTPPTPLPLSRRVAVSAKEA
ncbi:hypothetical protein, partial [Burkholderia pseudomultivorans]|uniref:hypothetical protein n=1 Tax=Burkholderia pseudomultivorans TaxID=1207504 RepID=UPI001E470711